MIGHKKGWQSRLPLGPFLVIGALTAMLWGQAIISWYLGLF
jgi:prepilin signal peptidase PulO-like enzyme (type II secretory pathway)